MIEYLEEDKSSLTIRTENFDLKQTFECGQCFRWVKSGENRYTGVVEGKVIRVRQDGSIFTFEGINKQEFDNQWIHYFDLDRDYASLISQISIDPLLKEAAEFGKGIRLLLQNEWETTVSFIISSNNNIPRIKKIISSLCIQFGDRIESNGETYYTFPAPEKLATADCKDMDEIRCGYRSAYIIDAAGKVSGGEVRLSEIRKMGYEEGRNELLKIKGVGPKVADCILLYGAGKYESYPVDVWVKKVTEQLFLKKDSTMKEIKEFASSKWSDAAGFAQQYLFYYAREKGL
ncbi:MAG: 8-oxoguanine DNA glycosylase [Eubacteriaceae bacterium]|nr:8-oxoguanine DNA glycosylase [Eubacteriaceae bacterium]